MEHVWNQDKFYKALSKDHISLLNFVQQVRLTFEKYVDGATTMTVSDREETNGQELPRFAVCPGFKPSSNFEKKEDNEDDFLSSYLQGRELNNYFNSNEAGKWKLGNPILWGIERKGTSNLICRNLYFQVWIDPVMEWM